jgi:hypothetical protein
VVWICRDHHLELHKIEIAKVISKQLALMELLERERTKAMENEEIALDKCAKFGLHPVPDRSDGHHTDLPFSEEDKQIGEAVAWFLGGLFVDVQDNPHYMNEVMTSVDAWSRVARALRHHGLQIADSRAKPENGVAV